MELNGAVAVVTGASSGIGEATAVALANAGARVVLAARRLERLEEIAEWISDRGGEATALRCDVADRGEVRTLAAVVDEAFGRCDVLVNNAGVPGGGSFVDVDMDTIENVVRVNVLGVVLVTKAFLPMMLDAGRSHVVNVASIAGRFAMPGSAVYSATKHAVVAFSESLYYELASRGVLVTSVNPGLVATESFPQGDIDARLVMHRNRVARAIVGVLEHGRAPEITVPRWVAPLQLARVVAPRPYRWGVRTATARLLARRGSGAGGR